MEEIIGLQIIGALFGILMAYITFLHYKRKEFTRKELVLWAGLWSGFILITMIPTLLDPIITGLKFARRLDFYIIMGFLLLIGVTFRNYSLVRKEQKRIETMVRKIAMKKDK